MPGRGKGFTCSVNRRRPHEREVALHLLGGMAPGWRKTKAESRIVCALPARYPSPVAQWILSDRLLSGRSSVQLGRGRHPPSLHEPEGFCRHGETGGTQAMLEGIMKTDAKHRMLTETDPAHCVRHRSATASRHSIRADSANWREYAHERGPTKVFIDAEHLNFATRADNGCAVPLPDCSVSTAIRSRRTISRSVRAR